MIHEDFLWVEKYRPKTLAECILPPDTRKVFQAFIDQRNVPNVILAGGAGVGKTTVAKAVLNEIGCDFLVINGSLDRNIGTLRNDIEQYASTVSLVGGRKYVILDEADYLNKESTMPALRTFMEEFSGNTGFILTCNWINRIISPLQSRCSIIEFNVKKTNAAVLRFAKRAIEVLKTEGVPYDPESVYGFVDQKFPDFRKTLNELQKYAAHGKIDVGILARGSIDNFEQLIGFVKNKEYTKVVQWVADNKDVDFTTFCHKFYEAASTQFAPADIPKIVLILADYQYKNAFVADQQLNALAMLTEVMLSTGD